MNKELINKLVRLCVEGTDEQYDIAMPLLRKAGFSLKSMYNHYDVFVAKTVEVKQEGLGEFDFGTSIDGKPSVCYGFRF